MTYSSISILFYISSESQKKEIHGFGDSVPVFKMNYCYNDMKNFDEISILSEVMQAITLVHENKPLQKAFKRMNKLFDTELQLKLCRKVLNKTNHVRYLGVKIDENLNWKTHVHDLAAKLNRTN